MEKAWEPGNLKGHEGAAKSAIRVKGAGPPPRAATLEDLLSQYYVQVSHEQKALCARSLMKVKAAQLVCAARDAGSDEVEGAFLDDGKVSMAWVEALVKKWEKRCGLRAKAPGRKAKLPQADLVFRAHLFFRNLVRVRAA